MQLDFFWLRISTRFCLYSRSRTMMSSPTILIADDSSDDIELLRRAFARAGFSTNVQSVRSGLELIQYLRGEGAFADRDRFPFPRLIFLDFKMQGMGGWDVLRWIRQRPEYRSVPGIIFRGSD